MGNFEISANIIVSVLAVIATYITLFQKIKKERKEWTETLALKIKEEIRFQEGIQTQIDNLKMEHKILKQDIEGAKKLSDTRATDIMQRLDRFEDKIDQLNLTLMNLKIK